MGTTPHSSRALFVAILLAAACPVSIAGRAGEERGAKAAALANAFVAQADDPTAVYFNPAGLAFHEDRAFATGFVVPLVSRTRFAGFDPDPGAGTGGRWRIEPEPKPQVYWVEPVAERWAVGMALVQGENFDFEWRESATWAGRFESHRSALRSWDLSAVAAVRLHRSLGVSAGVNIRATTFSWERNETGINPSTQATEEIGFSRLDSDPAVGVGAVIGLLYRPDGRWSLGLRWRSAIVTQIDGRGSYTQILTGDAVFDALASGLLPFGQRLDWTARLRHPERLAIGAGFALTPNALIEFDLEHVGWDSMNGWSVRFAGLPALDRSTVAGWQSRVSTRIGLRWNGLGNGEWRAGVYRDPTPQPEQDLGPFFVGTDRFGATIGYGTRVERLQTDVALVWEERDERSTRSHGFDGSYASRVVRLVLTFGW